MATEKIQAKHVEDQVTNICMQQSAAKETIPLPPLHSGRIKDQVIHDLIVAESCKGDKTRNNDDYDRRGYFHEIDFAR